jgi:Mg2+ and Co2+ transporter CorA
MCGFLYFLPFLIIFYFRDKFKQFLESIDSDNEDRQDRLRTTGQKNKKHIYITNGNPLGGSGSGDQPDDLYVARKEFIEFKTQIENRFDNLMKGYGKLEGKFDAFNQIWRQEIGDLKSELDDVKNEVHELSENVNIINTNMSRGFKDMSDRFTMLVNEIKNLAIRNS